MSTAGSLHLHGSLSRELAIRVTISASLGCSRATETQPRQGKSAVVPRGTLCCVLSGFTRLAWERYHRLMICPCPLK